ncbi:MAG TPA: helix-turn-helix transcriptional regulator [Verrucomicrobiae bacterium]|nr:helix-turn-helix transcriptional regulator [Verrucomicrobiae bacterium]
MIPANGALALVLPPARVERALPPTSPILKLLGCAIRCERHERRFTMETLAAAAGLSYQYLSEVERGQTNFSILVLERIAIALEMTLPELATRAGNVDLATAPMLRRVRLKAPF